MEKKGFSSGEKWIIALLSVVIAVVLLGPRVLGTQHGYLVVDPNGHPMSGFLDDSTSAISNGLYNASSGGIDANLVGSSIAVGFPPYSYTAPTNANVGVTTSQVTILAATTNRKDYIIWNTSPCTLYLQHGTTVNSTTNYEAALVQNGVEVPNPQAVYAGQIEGMWSANCGGSGANTSVK